MKCLTFFAVLFSLSSYSQTTTINEYITIPSGTKITKVVTNKYVDTLSVGTVVKRELERNYSGTKSTVTVWDTITSGEETKYSYSKKESINLGSLSGKATLRISEDKSFIHVNYWLNKKREIPVGTKYKVLKRKIDKKTKFDKTLFNSLKFRKTKKDSTVYLVQVSATNSASIKSEWFQKSDLIIAIYASDTINRYLVNKFDRDGDYRIKLKNRQYLSAWRLKAVVGPVTIPLKYRAGYSVGDDSIIVKNDFAASANLGLFGGVGFGKYRVRYEKDQFKVLPEFGGVFGLFANLSTVDLDSLSTTAGRVPFSEDEKGRMGVFSTGFGLMFGMNDVSVGGFVGWDFGLGSDAKHWNFNNQFWIGLGITYSPSLFWNKD